jgi:multidrug resistance protein, MATE family
LRQIVLFSIPSIAASLLEPLAGIVDTALVGRLDTKMLAALAVGTTLLSSFTWIFNFLIHASTQSIASSDDLMIGARTRLSLSVALGVGIISAFFLYLFRLPLYEFIGQSTTSSSDVDAYFLPRLIGHPLLILMMTSLSVLRGLSKVNLALILVVFSTLINIVLTWIFLYVLNWGLAGAAWASVSANVLGLLVALFYLWREPRIRLSFKLKVNRAEWFSFGQNSLNLFMRSFALSASLFLAARFAATQGAQALASHQIILQVWLFVSFFVDGVAITANILVSKYVSQKNIRELNLVILRTLILGLYLGTIFTLIYFIFEDFIQGLFTTDPQVLQLLRELWPWIAITQIPNALAFVYDGVLFGFGAIGGFTWVKRWMTLGVLFIFLPLAFIFPGLNGIWSGLILLNFFRLLTGWWTTGHLLAKIKA